jgi:hypothetical protein
MTAKLEQAADRGGHHRHQRHAHGHVGKLAGGTVARMQVAHDRACQHEAGARAERLGEASGEQRLHRRREQAGEAADEPDRQPDDQDRPPPVAVRERPVDELAERHARQEQRQGELGGPVARAERIRQAR